jgi:hypothetical protein
LNTFEIFITRGKLAKLFKAVGALATGLVVTSGHSKKKGSFINQKANWISSKSININPLINILNTKFQEGINIGI